MAAKVLIVEDERDLLMMMALRLRSSGFEVETAVTGQEFYQKLEKGLPDVILLDLMLPDMHGFDILDHVKQDAATKEIPVIVVTARGQPAQREKAVEKGAVDFVKKPMDMHDLIKRIRSELFSSGGRRQGGSNEARFRNHREED